MPVSAKQRRAMALTKQARKYQARSKPTIQRSLPASMTRQIQQAVRRAAEAKYVDFIPRGGVGVPVATFLVSTDLTTNGTIFCINPMQQGTAFYNRIGRKTKTESIRLKLNFDYAFSTNLTAYTTGNLRNVLRVAVVYDRENTGVIPSFDNIFRLIEENGSAASKLTTPLSLIHSDRYRVLMDETINMYPESAPSYGDYDIATGVSTAFYTTVQSYTIDRFIDCSKKNLLQSYQSTSNPATVADLSSGAIYLVMKILDYQIGVNEVYCRDSMARIKVSDV